jgi:SAM-dependent methyltransferase
MLGRSDAYWVEFWNKQQTALHHSSDPAFFTMLSGELRLLLPDVKSRRILDLGCGAGELHHHLGFDGAKRYRGVDLSSRMLERFRERFPGVDLRCESADRYWSEDKYDLIFVNAIVQYLDRGRLAALIENTERMLDIRGYIMLGMIPWAPLKRSYYGGDVAPPDRSASRRAIHLLKTMVRDSIGHWYRWSDIRRLAAMRGLAPFFYGSITDPYRFHVVMTRLNDFEGQPDETLARLLASRRP